MACPFYIFAGGGTGGHIYPGLAVAEELLRRQPEARVVFACSTRPIDRHVLDPTPHAVVVQPVRPMPRGPRGWLTFARSYLPSAAQARQMLRDLKPPAVLGLGGFAAGPMLCRAATAGVRTALLNPDAVAGRANRLLARRADAVFTQFGVTAESFGRSVRSKVRRVGCPIRAGFAEADRAEALEQFGLRADRKTLFVNGGSQGAASINAATAELTADLAELAGTWQVLHVTGPEGAGAGQPPPGVHVRRLAFCRRMDLAYAAADLALCRAGAGTVAEATATATPAIFMPYPYHADQHQRLNAQPLRDAGAAEICDDAKDARANAESLRRVLLPILREPERLSAMRRAAEEMEPLHAAVTVARWLIGEEA